MFILENIEGTQVIAGFNSQHGIVQRSTQRAYAKQFKTETAALKWLDKHTDVGHGIKSNEYVAVRA